MQLSRLLAKGKLRQLSIFEDDLRLHRVPRVIAITPYTLWLLIKSSPTSNPARRYSRDRFSKREKENEKKVRGKAGGEGEERREREWNGSGRLTEEARRKAGS